MKKIVALFLILMGINTYAHQPHLASFVFSKTDDGKYVVQFVGALTGFEGEINYNYGENAFKSPEEFRALVIDYFNKSTTFSINQQKMTFENPMVILGHETKLVAEVTDVPETVESIEFKNTFFQNTSHNQLTVLFVDSEFPKEKWVLSNKNQHRIRLIKTNGKWEDKSTYQKGHLVYYGIALGVLIFLSIVGYLALKRKN